MSKGLGFFEIGSPTGWSLGSSWKELGGWLRTLGSNLLCVSSLNRKSGSGRISVPVGRGSNCSALSPLLLSRPIFLDLFSWIPGLPALTNSSRMCTGVSSPLNSLAGGLSLGGGLSVTAKCGTNFSFLRFRSLFQSSLKGGISSTCLSMMTGCLDSLCSGLLPNLWSLWNSVLWNWSLSLSLLRLIGSRARPLPRSPFPLSLCLSADLRLPLRPLPLKTCVFGISSGLSS